MRRYVARRLVWAVVAAYLVLTVTFGLLVVTPDVTTAEVQFRAAQGGGAADALDPASEPVWQRYVTYVTRMTTLDWGWAESQSQPVTTAILRALPYSLMYTVPAVGLATVAGVAAGLYSAAHRHSAADHALTAAAFFGLSVPDFWLAVVLLLVFGVHLDLVPVIFDAGVPAFSAANARQLALPVVVVATATVASVTRYARSETLAYARETFVKAARAKGASDRRVMLRHVLRPALVPLITVIAGDLLGVVFAASYLVEYVFGIPGIARLSYTAIVEQDTALVLGTTLVPAFVAIFGNLVQDVAYAVLDPRIDYGDRQ